MYPKASTNVPECAYDALDRRMCGCRRRDDQSGIWGNLVPIDVFLLFVGKNGERWGKVVKVLGIGVPGRW